MESTEADHGKKPFEPKVVPVLHLNHYREDKGLAMFPFGTRYNKELYTLKSGDFIKFTGENGHKREVISVAVMNLHSAVAELMSNYIYGQPLRIVHRQWGYNAVMEGFPRDAVDKDRCLLIHYKI